MIINSISDFRRAMRLPRYGMGGYENYFITTDGAALCMKCAKEERFNILWSLAHDVNDGWRVVAITSSADSEDYQACDHCSHVINEGPEQPDPDDYDDESSDHDYEFDVVVDNDVWDRRCNHCGSQIGDPEVEDPGCLGNIEREIIPFLREVAEKRHFHIENDKGERVFPAIPLWDLIDIREDAQCIHGHPLKGVLAEKLVAFHWKGPISESKVARDALVTARRLLKWERAKQKHLEHFSNCDEKEITSLLGRRPE